MKLLYCPACNDIFNLSFIERRCSCGKTCGHYKEDGIKAEFSGGVPLAIHNAEFRAAIEAQKKADPKQQGFVDSFGERFGAWIIPANSTSFRPTKNKRKGK